MNNAAVARTNDKFDYIAELDSPIAQIAAFNPPIRSGKSENRRELKMQRSASKKIYLYRFRIAKEIVKDGVDENTLMPISADKEQRKRILSKAMIAAGLSPKTNDGWLEYMSVLIDKSGGWKIFMLNLRDEVYRMAYYKKNILSFSLITVVSVVMCMFVLSQAFVTIGIPSLASYGIVLSLSSVFVIGLSWITSSTTKKRATHLLPKRMKNSERVNREESKLLLMNS